MPVGLNTAHIPPYRPPPLNPLAIPQNVGSFNFADPPRRNRQRRLSFLPMSPIRENSNSPRRNTIAIDNSLRDQYAVDSSVYRLQVAMDQSVVQPKASVKRNVMLQIAAVNNSMRDSQPQIHSAISAWTSQTRTTKSSKMQLVQDTLEKAQIAWVETQTSGVIRVGVCRKMNLIIDTRPTVTSGAICDMSLESTSGWHDRWVDRLRERNHWPPVWHVQTARAVTATIRKVDESVVNQSLGMILSKWLLIPNCKCLTW